MAVMSLVPKIADSSLVRSGLTGQRGTGDQVAGGHDQVEGCFANT